LADKGSRNAMRKAIEDALDAKKWNEKTDII